MENISKRQLLRAISIMGALGALHSPVVARLPDGVRPFIPPASPMQFSRKLVRNLSDGNAIIVTRKWLVQFETIGAGFALRGQQISVDVQAPAALKRLADLEKNRSDNGLFPVMLTKRGIILGQSGSADKRDVDRAIAIARQQIATSELSANDRIPVQSFLKTLQDSGAVATTTLPPDLFVPQQLSSHQQESMELPGGLEGTIIIAFTAQVEEGTGLLRRAERVVTTQIGQTRQLSSEQWTLAPSPPS